MGYQCDVGYYLKLNKKSVFIEKQTFFKNLNMRNLNMRNTGLETSTSGTLTLRVWNYKLRHHKLIHLETKNFCKAFATFMFIPGLWFDSDTNKLLFLTLKIMLLNPLDA
jgi:hypothetical protein